MKTHTSILIFTFAMIALLSAGLTHASGPIEDECGGAIFLHQLPLSTPQRTALPGESSFLYLQWTPRVVDTQRTESAVLTVVVDGNPTAVEILPADGGPTVPLSPVGPGMFEVVLRADDLLSGYRVGTYRQAVGRLRILDGDTLAHSRGLKINVKDGTMGSATSTILSASMQMTERVVNIRRDDPWLGLASTPGIPIDVTRSFYRFFEDDADFLVLVGNVTPSSNSFYSPVRNDTDGIGLLRFDNGANLGSDARLQGLISIPISTLFDLSGLVAQHEIAHRWINFLNEVPPLAVSGSHWPISDLAYGVIGIRLLGGEGGMFPFVFREIEEGYLLRSVKPADRYTDLELYLMGLIGPEEVGEHIVFVNQDQRDQIHDGGILAGPVEVVRIDDIIAAVGERVPGPASAQRTFHVATVVLSLGRLLTDVEMSFFEAMAARGESRRRYLSVISRTATPRRPFFHATGGRAELFTSLPPLKSQP